MSNIDRARAIAKLAHKGQKYSTADYFQYHVQGVVSLCEQNKHCTYGAVEVAYLHDVLEDTDLTAEDLRDFGVEDWVISTVLALTKMDGEDYMDYLSGVVDHGMTAMFVKYHDLRFNASQCRAQLTDRVCPITKDRAKSLLKRYDMAMQILLQHDSYFLYER